MPRNVQHRWRLVEMILCWEVEVWPSLLDEDVQRTLRLFFASLHKRDVELAQQTGESARVGALTFRGGAPPLRRRKITRKRCRSL